MDLSLFVWSEHEQIHTCIIGLDQWGANFFKREPHIVLKFDRRAGPGANQWRVLVIHLIRKRKTIESGLKKHASILIEKKCIQNFFWFYFKTVAFISHFSPNCTNTVG